MRPSNVETSEPACVNRKMLSTNSSTSRCFSSRKYSAIVSADSATRRHAGRLVHLSEHERSLLDDAGLGHLQEEIVALAGALPHAGEHRHATVLLGLSPDHLLDDHGLAHPGAAEHPDLP